MKPVWIAAHAGTINSMCLHQIDGVPVVGVVYDGAL